MSVAQKWKRAAFSFQYSDQASADSNPDNSGAPKTFRKFFL